MASLTSAARDEDDAGGRDDGPGENDLGGRRKPIGGGGEPDDGDGNRVKTPSGPPLRGHGQVQNGQTTIYIGALYEKNLNSGEVTTYYFAGSQRVAMRKVSSLYYFAADHPAQRAAASRTRRRQHQRDPRCQRQQDRRDEVLSLR